VGHRRARGLAAAADVPKSLQLAIHVVAAERLNRLIEVSWFRRPQLRRREGEQSQSDQADEKCAHEDIPPGESDWGTAVRELSSKAKKRLEAGR
jgi:hypothetical protein